jgi:hypothetical protein
VLFCGEEVAIVGKLDDDVEGICNWEDVGM